LKILFANNIPGYQLNRYFLNKTVNFTTKFFRVCMPTIIIN
jgi:hypothetical protein